MENVTCNSCGNEEAVQVYVLQDYMFRRKDVSATYVRCKRCGLVREDPRPTMVEMARHYPSEYSSYNFEAARESSWLAKQAIEYGIGKRWRFVTKYKTGGKLLDVGCGTGLFLAGRGHDPNWELYGVEINENAARVARDQHQLKVRGGTLEQAAYDTGFFDVVTLWDVLEHLHDPLASLREIHRILKPDGVILVRSPNLRSWDAFLFGRYWAGWDAPRHLFVFEPCTLTRMLGTVGFSVMDFSCRSGGDVMFGMSVQFWLSAREKNKAASRWLMNIVTHPLLRLLTSPLFFIKGLDRRGSLMIATAAKTSK